MNSVHEMLDYSKDLRLLLHQYIYSNDEYMNILIEIIKNKLNISYVEYNKNMRQIDIVLKDNNGKKSNDIELIGQYNNIINDLIYDFYFNHILKIILNNIKLSQDFSIYIKQPFINMLFNITVLSKTNIIIHL